MNTDARRRHLRAILEGDAAVHPATVQDPLSARIAEVAGYDLAVIPGSLASAVVLGVPDLILLTLTEFAEQCRRTARYTDLALIADADHGYGNALNVRRTVEELEVAGVAGLTLEDTLLPAPYGAADPMVSIPEMQARLRAALAARQDARLVIVARTNALNVTDADDAVARVSAYAETGVDAVMIVGAKRIEDVEAVGRSVRLPVILGNVPAGDAALNDLSRLAANGVRVAYQNQPAFLAAVQAQYAVMRHLHEGGDPKALPAPTAPGDLLDRVLRRGDYDAAQREYLAGGAAERS
ncbi:MAG: oxaloacetate decarboxylase [Dehalococcoidia bacterium]